MSPRSRTLPEGYEVTRLPMGVVVVQGPGKFLVVMPDGIPVSDLVEVADHLQRQRETRPQSALRQRYAEAAP